MAPLRPLPSKAAAPKKSILKHKAGTTSPKTTLDSPFPTTKQDKQRIKHAQLMSKVTKSTTSKPRRRRPNKKLVATLDSLADALPSANDDEQDDLEPQASDPTSEAKPKISDQVNIIKRKSMKSRPGAMKRKQKLDNSERDRFAKNLAQMAATSSSSSSGGNANTAVDKLKALRGFISQTLETRPEVASAKG